MADKVKIYDRLFDNKERGDNGRGEFLGEFDVVKQIREGIYLDQFIGKDTDGRLFFIDGKEVCGYGGGMRYEVFDLELTAADVAPVRHGRWVLDCSGVKCTACGEYPEKKDQCYTPFCCLCGAKMEVQDG